MDDQQKGNQTHDIVYLAAREEPRSISPDFGSNIMQGKKKKVVKKGKKGLNKKVTDVMVALPELQIEERVPQDSQKAPKSALEMPN